MRPIDGTKFKEFTTCPRLPFLSFHVPKDQELPPTARMRIFFAVGRRVEARILQELRAETVKFKLGDWEAGHAETLAAMERGVPAIANGVLKIDDGLGRPDLLLADGRGGYEVADVKSTHKVHASARLQIAFYSRLLARARPDRPAPALGHVILRDGSRDTFDVLGLQASIEHLIERFTAFRTSRDADPGAHRIDACADCRYRAICDADLAAQDDLSLCGGVTRAQKHALARAGVATATALLDAEDLAAVAAAAGANPDFVRRARLRTQALREGRPLACGAPRADLSRARIALAATFDERLAEPAVAIGGLVLDDSGKSKVRFLRARENAAAADADLKEFVVNLKRSEGPILVHGAQVERALEALRDRVAAALGDDALDSIEDRLLDLRHELRRAVALCGSDRTPLFAARAAGIAGAEDEAGDAELAALAWLEESSDDAGVGRGAIETVLRRDLALIARLRRLALDAGGGA